MGKKSAKARRAVSQRDRSAKKDEKGVRLTSSRRRFSILPSDFAEAMRQPPGAPKEATRKMDPERPTTAIPELNAIEFTPFAYQTVLEAITAASDGNTAREA